MSSTRTPADTWKESFESDERLAGASREKALTLPPGRMLTHPNIFALITPEAFADARFLCEWYSRSLRCRRPPFGPTRAHQVVAIAAALWLSGPNCPRQIYAPIGFWVTMMRNGTPDPRAFRYLDEAFEALERFEYFHRKARNALSATLSRKAPRDVNAKNRQFARADPPRRSNGRRRRAPRAGAIRRGA